MTHDEPTPEPALPELVAVMAHDLNNPIAALVTNLSFIEGALSPPPGSEMSEALSDTIMLCDVLRRLVGNLDLIARRERLSGGTTIADVREFVRTLVERTRKQAIAAEIDLELEPKGSTSGAVVHCDRELLGRAIENLIAYALEQAPSRTQIAVSVAGDAKGVRVSVEHRRRPQVAQPTESRPSSHPSMARAERRRQTQSLYGRGAALLCARLAAELIGGRLEVIADGEPIARLTLHAPASAM
jgi:K+-sensing histidine kinase KdpD